MWLDAGCKAMALFAVFFMGSAALAQQIAPELNPWEIDAEEKPEHVPDPARGEKLFRECRKCHEVDPGLVKIGPSLSGIVGRRPGSIPEFGYSQDMVDFGASGIVWNTDNLDQFLTKPRALIPGTKMVFQGFRKPDDRSDLIAYLSTVR